MNRSDTHDPAPAGDFGLTRAQLSNLVDIGALTEADVTMELFGAGSVLGSSDAYDLPDEFGLTEAELAELAITPDEAMDATLPH